MTARFKAFLCTLLLITIGITACRTAQEAPDEPAASPTTKPPPLATLEARSADFVIDFDDDGCTVVGPGSVQIGEYHFVVNNQSDLPLTLWVAPYIGEGSFEDHWTWREENCGGQGAHCENEEGEFQSYSLVAWTNPIQSANDGIQTYYKVYDLNKSGEYVIWVSKDGYYGYLCEPLQVTN